MRNRVSKYDSTLVVTAFVLMVFLPQSAQSQGPEIIPHRTPAGKWCFVDAHGVVRIPALFIGARAFSEGLAAVQLHTSRWGFIDEAGTFRIPAAYDEAGSFERGRALVRLGSRWLWINRRGIIVAER